MSVTEVTPLLHDRYLASSSASTEGNECRAKSNRALNHESGPANKWRIAATFYGFFVVGAADGAYGVRAFRRMVVLIA